MDTNNIGEWLSNNKLMVGLVAAAAGLFLVLRSNGNNQSANRTVLLQTGDLSAGVQGPEPSHRPPFPGPGPTPVPGDPNPDPHGYRNPGPRPGPDPIPPEPVPFPAPGGGQPDPHGYRQPGTPVYGPKHLAIGGPYEDKDQRPSTSHSYLSTGAQKFRIAQVDARNRVS